MTGYGRGLNPVASPARGCEAWQIRSQSIAEIHHCRGFGIFNEPMGLGKTGGKGEMSSAFERTSEPPGDGDDVTNFGTMSEDAVLRSDDASHGNRKNSADLWQSGCLAAYDPASGLFRSGDHSGIPTAYLLKVAPGIDHESDESMQGRSAHRGEITEDPIHRLAPHENGVCPVEKVYPLNDGIGFEQLPPVCTKIDHGTIISRTGDHIRPVWKHPDELFHHRFLAEARESLRMFRHCHDYRYPVFSGKNIKTIFARLKNTCIPTETQRHPVIS